MQQSTKGNYRDWFGRAIDRCCNCFVGIWSGNQLLFLLQFGIWKLFGWLKISIANKPWASLGGNGEWKPRYTIFTQLLGLCAPSPRCRAGGCIFYPTFRTSISSIGKLHTQKIHSWEFEQSSNQKINKLSTWKFQLFYTTKKRSFSTIFN